MLDKIRQLVGIELHQAPARCGITRSHLAFIRVVAHQGAGSRPSALKASLLQYLGRDHGVGRQGCPAGGYRPGRPGAASQGDPLLLAAGEAGAELPTRGRSPWLSSARSAVRAQAPSTATITLGVPGLTEQDVVADGVVHQPGFMAQMGNPAVAADAAGKLAVKAGNQMQQAALARPGGW